MTKSELVRMNVTRPEGNALERSTSDAGRPETVRVRMTVDLVGPVADELEKTAHALGRTKADLVREGLGYIFRALQARNDGFFVGAWKEEEDGRVSRAREFY